MRNHAELVIREGAATEGRPYNIPMSIRKPSIPGDVLPQVRAPELLLGLLVAQPLVTVCSPQ